MTKQLALGLSGVPKLAFFLMHFLFQHRQILWKEIMCLHDLVILLTDYLFVLRSAQVRKHELKKDN